LIIFCLDYTPWNWRTMKMGKHRERMRATVSGFWEYEENRRESMFSMAEKLSIVKQSQWYDVTVRDMRSLSNQSSGLLAKYGYSLQRALISLMPSYQWTPWLFSSVANQFWRDKKNTADYFQWLAENLGISDWEHWYGVRRKDVIANRGGSGLMCAHRGQTLSETLFSVWSQYPWQVWKFRSVPSKVWIDVEIRSKCVRWWEEQLGLKSPTAWYDVRTRDLIIRRSPNRRGTGRGLLQQFSGSLRGCVTSVYPEYEWQWWQWKRIHGPWHMRDSYREQLLTWLAKVFGIGRAEQWYLLRLSDIAKAIGQRRISATIFRRCLLLGYPQVSWSPWLFPSVSRGFRQQIGRFGGATLLSRFGGLSCLLREFLPRLFSNKTSNSLHSTSFMVGSDAFRDLPSIGIRKPNGNRSVSVTESQLEIPIEFLRGGFSVFSKNPSRLSKHQLYLFSLIRGLIPAKCNVFSNFQILPDFRSRPLGKLRKTLLEFDVYVPELLLALEYQGEEHYHCWSYKATDLQSIRSRDSEKAQVMVEK